MSVSYGGDSITFADGSVSSGGWTGFKNRIINGSMVVSQRSNTTVQTNVTGGQDVWLVDRWRIGGSALTGKVSFQQVFDAPAGFVNSGKITVTTAQPSYNTSDVSVVSQIIEGNNVADFNWGASNATGATLSFWVKASLTGTYTVAIRSDNVSNNYSYLAAYTINSANTWEYKTVSIPAITSGNWGGLTLSNSYGIRIDWNLGSGTDSNVTPNTWVTTVNAFRTTSSVQLLSTIGATFQFTGVQLEKGSTASSFEYRPYGTEFALCQRYFQRYANQPSAYLGNGNNARNGYLPSFIFPVKMRTSPSAGNITGFVSGNATTYAFSSPSVTTTTDGLYELYGATSTSIGYAEPFCAFFTTLDLSAEM